MIICGCGRTVALDRVDGGDSLVFCARGAQTTCEHCCVMYVRSRSRFSAALRQKQCQVPTVVRQSSETTTSDICYMGIRMAQPAQSDYRYSPLRGTEIRLIALKPYDETIGTVECSLRQAPLGSVPFDTLSYVWGDRTDTVPILLDGNPFPITKNLARCLRVLAQRRAWPGTHEASHRDHLWADAICINQGDIDERNAQILRMRDIYATASVVLAWVGEVADSTHLAFDWLVEASAASGGAVFAEAESPRAGHINEMIRRLMDPANSSTLDGVNDFFTRHWWRRAWVVQEAVQARKLYLICSELVLPYAHFSGAWKAFYQAFTASAETHMVDAETRVADWPATIFNVKVAAESRGLLLAELLRFTRRAEALDPRDRIYALLGISADFASGDIKPDYRLSPKQVYIMTVKAHIAKHGSLDILEGCELQDLPPRGWPSWVPQWNVVEERPTEFSWSPGFIHNKGLYDASGGRKLADGQWNIDDTAGKLHISGVLVDTITQLSDMAVLCSKAYENEKPEEILKRWMDLIPQLDGRYVLTGETMKQAFKRTLVIDRRLGIGGEAKKFTRGFGLTLPWERPGTGQDLDETLEFHDGITGFMMTADLRRLALTSRGMIGLVPGAACLGDEIVVLLGGQFPYVVRPMAEETDRNSPGSPNRRTACRLVGEAYIHGIMDGEMMSTEGMGEITLV